MYVVTGYRYHSNPNKDILTSEHKCDLMICSLYILFNILKKKKNAKSYDFTVNIFFLLNF